MGMLCLGVVMFPLSRSGREMFPEKITWVGKKHVKIRAHITPKDTYFYWVKDV
jgi:hypothetical protein